MTLTAGSDGLMLQPRTREHLYRHPSLFELRSDGDKRESSTEQRTGIRLSKIDALRVTCAQLIIYLRQVPVVDRLKLLSESSRG